MTIDNSWITLQNRRCPNNFIEIAKNHVDDEGKTCCLCIDCVNMFRHIVTTVYAHIHDRGFEESYLIWIHHGEEYPPSDLDNLWASKYRSTRVVAKENPHEEMFNVIDDVMAKEDPHIENISQEETALDPGFDALFEEANTELYPVIRMSVHVARGHRGDGGGEPPRQPHTIPKACDSSKPKRDYKRKVYLTLHNYFDIESFRDTPHWNGIVQGIDADFKASYRRRKSKVYGSSHGAEPYAQKRHKEKKETVMQNHIDGWKKSYFKEGNGWCHPQAQHDWGKIMQEYRKMLEEVDGDDSLVDQTECLKRALGERSSHTRELTQQMSQQFTEQMHQMFLSQNPNAQPPQFQFTFDPSRLQVPNGHDVNEEDEESQGYENEDDEMEEGDQNEEWENSSSGPDN
ncbi:unnamed protein product [Lactuca saligna]|uniref:Transposase-associated domain-containing protein n=1 Tax=Lactuca saligna TaxID=75948 RepID=A0AA36E660_LACSI|nr:unnamed protein product [Lactuca saligna]